MTRKLGTRKRRRGDKYRGPFVRPFSAFRNYIGRTLVYVTTGKSRRGRRARRTGGDY